MAAGTFATPFGKLRIQATNAETVQLAKDVALEAAEEWASTGRFVTLGDRTAYIKASPLRGKSRFRHAMRGLFFRRIPPRLNEYANLRWLRRNDFLAPRPLAAGVIYRASLPCFQFLLTQAVPGAKTLDQHLGSAHAGERALLVEELGRETARMHGLGFTHRDLFVRNILVSQNSEAPHVYFLDAWRGGPLHSWRGPTYDIACLMLFGATLLTPEEQALFFRTYFSAGKTFKSMACFLRSVVRQWKGLLAILQRKPGRRRGLELPPHEWRPQLHLPCAKTDGRTLDLSPSAGHPGCPGCPVLKSHYEAPLELGEGHLTRSH